MQAQNILTRSPVIDVHQHTTAEDSPVTLSPTATASVSQPSFDRWAELPVDVVGQVMYWTMLGNGSLTGAMPFSQTSKFFAQAGQTFRDGPWYQDAQSVLMHQRVVTWTGNYLACLGCLPSIHSPATPAELDTTLELMSESSQGIYNLLSIERLQKLAPDNDFSDAFRNFHGTSLSLMTGKRAETREKIVDIARVLPPEVSVLVKLTPQEPGPSADADAAGLVGRVAASGRPTAFDFQRYSDLSVLPDALGAVLDVACGRGMVSFFRFGRIDDPDAMLSTLSDRCHQFRHLRLVMFTCENPPSREKLDALSATLRKREAAGLSRLTIVIGCDKLEDQDWEATPVFTIDERARFERAGLYLECVESGIGNPLGERRVLASVRGGAIDELPPQPKVMPVKLSWNGQAIVGSSDSDSDVIVASSDSDGSLDSSDDESQDWQAPRRTEARSAPRVVRRDNCVIS